MQLKKVMEDVSIKARNVVRFTQTFAVNLPVEKIDLYKWITEITPAGYESYSKSHKAMGSGFKDGLFYMVNVENIGFDTLVQHYELKSHTPSVVKFYRAKTKAYIMRWFPLRIGVPWEMQVSATSAQTCPVDLHHWRRIPECNYKRPWRIK